MRITLTYDKHICLPAVEIFTTLCCYGVKNRIGTIDSTYWVLLNMLPIYLWKT